MTHRLVELGDGEAPWQKLSPHRAMIKITKEPSPSFGDPHIWSDNAFTFVESATEKDPNVRPSCADLLRMPFLSGPINFDALVPLLETLSKTKEEPAAGGEEESFGDFGGSGPAAEGDAAGGGEDIGEGDFGF